MVNFCCLKLTSVTAQHFVDFRNHKFDTILLVMEETLDTLNAQSPTADAYDSLSNQINISFQWVFERIYDRKHDLLLASEAWPSHVRGGELRKSNLSKKLQQKMCLLMMKMKVKKTLMKTIKWLMRLLGFKQSMNNSARKIN